MERNHFMPRAALPGEDGGRDLPPTERGLIEQSPTPRMDPAPEGGCGCDGGKGEHGHDHDHSHGTCVCYEGCGEGSWGLSGHPLAMVYAPCQDFRALYDPATALNRGTLFTELDLSFGSTDGAFTTPGCACRAERRGV